MTAVLSLQSTRGLVANTQSMETLQQGSLHALAAAAGCTLGEPKPDTNGIDWTITLHSPDHVNVLDAKIDVQLKCTHQVVPNNTGDFGFQMKRAHFDKLATTQISNPRLLFVMICHPNLEKWVHTAPNITAIRHSMYWVDLYGKTSTAERPTVRVPYTQLLTPLELCRILHEVGNGDKPWAL